MIVASRPFLQFDWQLRQRLSPAETPPTSTCFSWNKTEIKLKQNKFVSVFYFLFCFTCFETKLKQICFVSVLFQFYFSFISHVRVALDTHLGALFQIWFVERSEFLAPTLNVLWRICYPYPILKKASPFMRNCMYFYISEFNLVS